MQGMRRGNHGECVGVELMDAHGVRLRAPAKVNLCLRVRGKRSDGFHELETVMAATTLTDELLVRQANGNLPRGETRLHVSDPSVPAGEENLVQRAVQLVREETGFDAPLEIELHKRVPHGAGLGGGSADAAATLEGLNRLANLGRTPEQLAEWGARLGSDVPFFFYGPVARCEGRGERVTAWREGVPQLSLVVLFPRLHVSTAAVYGALEAAPLAPTSPTPEPLRPADLFNADGGLRRDALVNDLEAPACRVEPALARVFSATADAPCLHRMLTGSGSASVFYVNPDEQVALARHLTERNLGAVFCVQTMPSMPRQSVFDLPPVEDEARISSTPTGQEESSP